MGCTANSFSFYAEGDFSFHSFTFLAAKLVFGWHHITSKKPRRPLHLSRFPISIGWTTHSSCIRNLLAFFISVLQFYIIIKYIEPLTFYPPPPIQHVPQHFSSTFQTQTLAHHKTTLMAGQCQARYPTSISHQATTTKHRRDSSLGVDIGEKAHICEVPRRTSLPLLE